MKRNRLTLSWQTNGAPKERFKGRAGLSYKGPVVEAVGMWEGRCLCGLSKDGGKGGKPAFGFPSFPPAGISTAHLASAGLSPFLPFARVRRKRYDSVPVSSM